MLKLYKKLKGKVTHYHEAWVDGSWVTEHWGEIGTEGETKRYRTKKGLGEEGNISEALAAARADGFKPVGDDKHAILIIEYAVKGMGSAKDVKKRQEIQDRMDNLLGWTGLGHCDGGSIGSGSMEVCCVVVDYETAKRVIESDLVNSRFSDFSRIYDEDAENG